MTKTQPSIKVTVSQKGYRISANDNTRRIKAICARPEDMYKIVELLKAKP